jgi:hypothetical protein
MSIKETNDTRYPRVGARGGFLLIQFIEIDAENASGT